MDKKTEFIGFKTTKEIRQQLEKLAKDQDRSISYVINSLIKSQLEETE